MLFGGEMQAKRGKTLPDVSRCISGGHRIHLCDGQIRESSGPVICASSAFHGNYNINEKKNQSSASKLVSDKKLTPLPFGISWR